MKVVEFKQPENDIAETIKEFSDKSDQFEAVMLLAVRNDGQQELITSTSSMYQKAFLVKFADAYITGFFSEFKEGN